jgi:L-aspartate oxidase
VEAIDRGVDGPEPTGAMRCLLGGGEIGGRAIDMPAPGSSMVPDREELQRTMTTHAGVLRSAESLGEAANACAGQVVGDDPGAWELRNIATVGRLLCAAALAREESRGAHTRTEFDGPREDLRLRFVAGG